LACKIYSILAGFFYTFFLIFSLRVDFEEIIDIIFISVVIETHIAKSFLLSGELDSFLI